MAFFVVHYQLAVRGPQAGLNAFGHIIRCFADAAFHAGYATSARKALEYAMTCPGAVGNPFLHLRYGQVLLDAGESDVAADELMRAHMGGGPEIFEAEDRHYLDFLTTRAKL